MRLKHILPTVLIFALACAAKDKTALNGTWNLIPTKSDFAGQPVMQTGSVTINERQGDITVTRNFAYEGAGETFFYQDMKDSRNSATIHASKDIKSKTKWEHDVLTVTTTEAGKTTVETYRLGPDGNLMATVMQPDHQPINLVFQRK